MNLQSTITLRTGRRMPILGLGTWLLKEHTAATIEEALQLGYPMIDTAGDYGMQPGIAEGVKRSDMDALNNLNEYYSALGKLAYA